jgi:hypothetical protein
MTPVVIETVLQCYYSCEPLPETPAVEQAIQYLLKDSIIIPVNEAPGYRCTLKGRKWVEMLLETPYPTNVWLDPRTAG